MDFRTKVERLAQKIPYGQVATYGQLAALAGQPRAARRVGVIANRGDQRLPWHRVVKASGHLATGYPGGVMHQKKLLTREGVTFNNDQVNLKKHHWLNNTRLNI